VGPAESSSDRVFKTTKVPTARTTTIPETRSSRRGERVVFIVYVSCLPAIDLGTSERNGRIPETLRAPTESWAGDAPVE
jgi:hypothetical protein